MSSNQVRYIVIALVATMVCATFGVWWLSSQTEPTQTLQEPLAKAPLELEADTAPVEPTAEPAPLPDVNEPVVIDLQPEPDPVQPAAPTLPKLFDFALPKLDESDSTLLAQLKSKLARESLRLLVDEGLIERFVVTADAIAQGKVPYNLLPVDRPAGSYKVIEAQGRLYSSTVNITRYQPYLDLMTAMPSEHWLALYEHIYPLLQQAYERLGYPQRAFHEVLLQAIEQLLTTTKPSASIELVQPNVVYEYADPELQQHASQLEKLMLRLGPDVNGKLKTLLREFQQELQQKQP